MIKLFNNEALIQMDIFIKEGLLFDAIIIDPPYGTTQNKWDSIIPLDKMWKRINKLIKPNGAVIVFSDGMFTSELKLSNKINWRYDLIWDKTISSGFLNANRMPLRIHETISVFYKNPPIYNPQKTIGKLNHRNSKTMVKHNCNYGNFNHVDNSEKLGNMKFPTSIIRIPKVHSSKTIHATQKPVEIMEYLIKTFLNFYNF